MRITLPIHRPTLLAAAVLFASLAMSVAGTQRAVAASALCSQGLDCASPVDAPVDHERQLLDLTADAQTSIAAGNATGLGPASLTSQEYFSFSGVGAIVCSINGRQHMSTAFLVGAFDIGVTVAHTFEENGHWTQAAKCVYTSTDSLGQIRERIPVSYIKAQWKSEAGAFGQPAKDFAVVRLKEPSQYAQRTMPLGKFSGAAAAVLMIGFKSDIDSDSLKQKSRGTVYGRKANGIALANLAGFTHDMDSRGIAAGAPVIDESTGVIIGIHTTSHPAANALGSGEARNTMITMNDWLERTLKGEMRDDKGSQTAAAGEPVGK
ncbi:MAG TPA: trypsin-like peptidase domain-containing protein [Steroidobacteraceae bacterium]|jgi:hypothetical protein